MLKKRIVLILSILLLCSSALLRFPASAEDNLVWETKASLPTSLTGSAIAEVDGLIYIFGGGTGTAAEAINSTKSNKTYKYDPSVNTWSEMQSMPTARAAATAAIVDGRIYIIGGYYDKNGVLTRSDIVEMYDPSTNTWETKSKLQTARSWAGSAVVNNKIYVFGGGSSNSTGSLNTVEVYDPSSNSWAYKSNLPVATNAPGVVAVNGKIFISGGTSAPYGTTIYSKNLWEYSPVTDTFSEKKSTSFERAGFSMVEVNGDIYFLGSVVPIDGTSPVEKYNIATDSWSTITNLTSWRFQSASISVGNTIYIIGGTTNQTNGILKTVQSLTIAVPEVTPSPTVTPAPSPTVTPFPTPEQPTGDRAILVVTMNTGLEKEFDLSMAEVNAFIDWYENKQSGIGTASYAIDKHENNKGPFTSRKDYVIFDKILTFEVSEYTTD